MFIYYENLKKNKQGVGGTEAKDQPAQLVTCAPAVKCILSDEGGSHARSLVSITIQWESGTVITIVEN